MKRIIFLILLGMFFVGNSYPAFAASDTAEYVYAKAMMGDVAGLKGLINSGYSLESKDSSGNTAYCLAVYRRNQTAIKALELAGANVRPR